MPRLSASHSGPAEKRAEDRRLPPLRVAPAGQAGSRRHRQNRTRALMSLRDYILKNFWLKVFSVALAAFIWVVIESSLRVEKLDMKMPFLPFRSLETHAYRLPVATQIDRKSPRLNSSHTS